MKDVIVIGGGLAGLAAAIQLADAGLEVMLVEKKSYPQHRVCGEYISNEALPFLQSLGADPAQFCPPRIRQLTVSAPSGSQMHLPLVMGGFGLSRYALDHFLYTIALQKGVRFRLHTSVSDIRFEGEKFYVSLSSGETEEAALALGSFGKRSNLDRQLGRKFFTEKSPYIGVKYHIRTDFPDNRIALHNFRDGYCGISKVEEDKYCLCYLTTRENLKASGTIQAMQEETLFRNPFLKDLFLNSDFLYEEPLVINEISFRPKSLIEEHIFMAGDAAGLIAPLCGNGMSMAMHASKILSALIVKHYHKRNFDRNRLEQEYITVWNKTFASRLQFGRTIQSLFGKERMTDLTVVALKNMPLVSRWIVKQTHGAVF